MEHSTVGSVLRSTQAYCSQLCDKQTLDHGIAYYSERFAHLPEANQFREVLIDDSADVAAALDEANRWFRERGLACCRWAPASGEDSPELADLLTKIGFRRRTATAMRLAEWVELPPGDDVRIIHARSVRGALRDSFLQTPVPEASGLADSTVAREWLAEACEERLDDPQYDMFVALLGNKPAGRCALYQVGDIARVMELSVSPSFENTDVKQALTAHVLSLARRLAMRNVVALADDDTPTWREWFTSAGFVADGTIVEFHRSLHADSADS